MANEQTNKPPKDAREEKGHSRDNVGIMSREALAARAQAQRETAPKDTVRDQADGAGNEPPTSDDS